MENVIANQVSQEINATNVKPTIGTLALKAVKVVNVNQREV